MNISVIFCLLVTFINLNYAGKRKALGKVTYDINWSSGFQKCEKFENKIVEMSGVKLVRDAQLSTLLSGEMEFFAPIVKGTSMMVVVEKETAQGKVIAYTMDVTDICDHVSEKGMPWSTFFDVMKLDPRNCPLPARKYNIMEMKLNLTFATSTFTRENVGEYVCKIQLQHSGEGLDVVAHTVSCYNFNFAIEESREKVKD